MYKVQNATPGNLPVDLEQGSIVLQSGQFLDLDLHCSRKWIKANSVITTLLGGGHLRLVHDSELVIPSPPITHPRKRPTSAPVAKKKKEKPVVIDLSKSEPKAKPAPVKEEPKPKEEPVVEPAVEDPIEALLAVKDEEKEEKKEKEPKRRRTYRRRKKKDEN